MKITIFASIKAGNEVYDFEESFTFPFADEVGPYPEKEWSDWVDETYPETDYYCPEVLGDTGTLYRRADDEYYEDSDGWEW